MYASFLKRLRLKSLVLGINHEVGNTKTKGLNMYVIRKMLTYALNFVGNDNGWSVGVGGFSGFILIEVWKQCVI